MSLHKERTPVAYDSIFKIIIKNSILCILKFMCPLKNVCMQKLKEHKKYQKLKNVKPLSVFDYNTILPKKSSDEE